MKLKSKLIMSGVALAACAATLTSTTYAWYTANTSVSADGIQAATVDTGTSSIQVAKEAGEKKNWTSKVTLATSDLKNYDTLTPLHYIENKVTSSETLTYSFKDLKGSETSTGYLSFTLYFRTAKTSANVPLYLKEFTATNADSSLTKHDNLVYDSTASGASINSDKGLANNVIDYSVDAVRCLSLVMDSTSLTSLKQKSYQVTEGELKEETNLTNANALTYYNSLTSAAITKGTTGLGTPDEGSTNKLVETTEANASGTALQIGELDKDMAVTTITFKVYLDGWDQYCFDACKGQRFKFTVSFTSDATSALKY